MPPKKEKKEKKPGKTYPKGTKLNANGNRRGMNERSHEPSPEGYYKDTHINRTVSLSAEALVYWNGRVKAANQARPAGTRAATLHSVMSAVLESIAQRATAPLLAPPRPNDGGLAFVEAPPTPAAE